MIDKSPLFIIGMPRSGTTLVSNLVNATKEVYIGVETHFFPILNKWKEYKKSRSISFLDYYFDTKHNPFLDFFNFDEEDILSIKKNTDVISKDPVKLLPVICEYQSKQKGLTRWGEKTPRHFEYIEEIYDNFPKAKVLYVLRDPRDVFLSLSKVDWRKSNENPWLFSSRFERGFKVMEKYESHENFRMIRYEDIIRQNTKILSEVFEFLEIHFTEDILFSFNKANNLNYDVKKEPWKANNAGKLNSDNWGKWKKDIDNERKYLYISKRLHQYMEKYGYSSDDLDLDKYQLYFYSTRFYWKRFRTKLKTKFKI